MSMIDIRHLEMELLTDEAFNFMAWNRLQNGFEATLPFITSQGVRKVRIWIGDDGEYCAVQGFDIAGQMIYEDGPWCLDDALTDLEHIIE